MDKLGYVVKTLSRTKRKDYENYVVNAVWQRLGNPSLKPVTQQCVRCTDGGHYFIDLYFPQLNMGVECDEGYHEDPVQKRRDEAREMELIDTIRQIDEGAYEALHVRVSGKSLEEVDDQIDDAVRKLRKEAERRRKKGTLEAWEPTANVWKALESVDELHVGDDMGFRTICDTCNAVLGCDYRGVQRSYFHPRGLNGWGKVKAWFPQLSVDGVSAAAGGWVNAISPDGMRIYQHPEGKGVSKRSRGDGCRRIVFARAKDPVTGEWLYRFVGQFEFEKVAPDSKGIQSEVFKRVDDSWVVVRGVGITS